MGKVFLILFLLMLLTVACSGRSNVWQPNSPTPPQFKEQPRLLMQPKTDPGRLGTLNIGDNTMDERLLVRAPSLRPLLAGQYQVINNILVGQGDQYINLPNGLASPNGLWLTSMDDDGLHLFRVDGGKMLLSPNGRFSIWSSDSQWLAYEDNDGLWAIETSSLVKQHLSSTIMEPLAWSENNQQLLLRSEKTAIIFDIVTKSEITLRGVDANQIHDQPVWSVDGATIYTRYGNQGNTDAVPSKVQARLVAIDVANGRPALRDLLPNVRNQGITTFLPSPDRAVLVVRHHVCRNEFGGLIPFIPTRRCDNSHLLVESATGHYQTLPKLPPEIVLAWERPFPATTLANLPLPTTSTVIPSLPPLSSFWQPDAALGHNPATAVPFGQAQSNGEGGKLLNVIDVVFGEDALALAFKANALPPFPGYTYVAVRQRIAREAGKASIYLTPRTRLVDDRLVAHQEILWLNADGQKITELEYSLETPAEYWQVFAIETNAQPWLLFASAGIADNWPDLYFRLDENAEWVEPTGVETLAVNTIGVAEPAEVGETAVSADWQITLLDTDPNELSTSASELVKVRVAYTAASPSANRLFTCLSQKNFEGIAGTKLGQGSTYNTQPFQSYEHQPCLLPGAIFEGWLAAFPSVEGGSIAFRFTPPSPQGAPFSDRTFVK